MRVFAAIEGMELAKEERIEYKYCPACVDVKYFLCACVCM